MNRGKGDAVTTRVLLADDHLLIRLGIKSLLSHLGDFEIVAEAQDGKLALELLEEFSPDLALIDISMPGLSGIETTLLAKRAHHDVKIIMLSAMEAADVVREALRAGADGYILKDCLLDELGEALAVVARGGIYVTPRLGVTWPEDESTAARAAEGALTSRQVQILRLIAESRTTKEIGKQLGISPKTVEFHRAQLMQRLGLHDIASLTRYATEKGLLPSVPPGTPARKD